jgi:hypothetical protein
VLTLLMLPRLAQLPHRGTGLALCDRPGVRASASAFHTWLRLPYRGTGLALCERPSTRASASAALTQALLEGLQRLGPERISSAARARPPQVARALCLGTAPEQAAPSGAPQGAPNSAQRPGHATSAISDAPRRRGRAGQRLRHSGPVLWQDPLCPPLTSVAKNAGSEGSRALPARPRMHERVAHARGAAELRQNMHERVTHAWGAAERENERVALARDAAERETEGVAHAMHPGARP